MSDIGHNSAGEELRNFIERWERLDEERKDIVDDQKHVMQEAKATGFDVKAMREVIRLRKMRPEDRQSQRAVLDTYCANLGLDDLL